MRRLPAYVGTWAAVAMVAAVLVAGGDTNSDDPTVPAETPPADTGPNIVLITTDDLSLAEMRYLPRVQRLLGEAGVSFTDFVAPQPLCCPSRAQLLTGQYAQNNGVRHNSGLMGGYQAFDPTTALPVWLQEAGYATAMVGKYLNGYGEAAVAADGPGSLEVGWDHWDPTIKRVYQYNGYTQYDDGVLTRPDEYHTDYVGERSRELIGELTAGDRPFFLWTSFVAPHGVCRLAQEAGGCDHPPIPAPRYRGVARGLQALTRVLPSFNERFIGDKPGILHRPPVDAAAVDRLQQRRAESLVSVDSQVARMVQVLRRSGELDNTLVVFTSDNGYLLGEHRWVGKVLAYEGSVRVPMLMRGLGLARGTLDAQSAGMIDLAPTFAVLAGATPLVEVDGHPLVARRGEAALERDTRTLLVQAGVANFTRHPEGWLFRGVRTARYTYVYWPRSDFEELYDRTLDSTQLRNVAADPAYAAILEELARRTAVLGECSGAACDVDFGPVPRADLPTP